MVSKKNPKKIKKKNPQRLGGSFFLNVSISVVKSLLLGFTTVLFLAGMLALGIGVGYFANLVEGTSSLTKTDVRQDISNVNEGSLLKYDDGQNIATINTDPIRQKVDGDEISPWVKKAIVATEDEYFYKHKGVVPKAVIRALLGEVTGLGSGSGGSTLTQQLVKQQVLTSETSFKRKANEILLAMDVEKYLSKDEILTAYLNISPFGRNNKGQNIAGVEEAAQGIFGVDAKDLSLAQSAFIAGLPQSPIVYSPYTNTGELKDDYSLGIERQRNVLFNMYREGAISKDRYEKAVNYDISNDFLPQGELTVDEHGFLYYTVYNEAINLLAKEAAKKDGVSDADFENESVSNRYVEQATLSIQNQGLTINSTINRNIYDAMQQSVTSYGSYLDDGSGVTVETGSVLMDNKTGKIYGFIGSRDYSTNQLNHAFDTSRQAASSIKPLLVYGPAIDQGLIGSESRISDYPTTYQEGKNNGKRLKNATNNGTRTFLTARDAIVQSSNISAYHLYQDILTQKGSTSYVYDTYLSKMNFPEASSWGLESAALGTTGVSTLTEVNGFQTLANEGVYQEGYLIDSITNANGKTLYEHESKGTEVFSKATASIMNDMMRSVIDEQETTPFKSILYSTNNTLASVDWVGKTGTADDSADNWLIVSSPSLTLGSWTGKDDNSAMADGTGNRTATYMAYLANQIYSVAPSLFDPKEKFELDDSVKKEKVSEFTGLKEGKVAFEGKNISVPGGDTTSLWATGGPADNTYKFGIGGTNANYKNYWDNKGNNSSDDEDDDE
ncbi:transglycosylase domain-containing protein [Enterococcus sp. AZ103]|uniref:transglycosylase domain-containing protein n=1 Tax=Enterococcus sp. AZ103 TaxID=2774628 RepID=UPI003F2836A8